MEDLPEIYLKCMLDKKQLSHIINNLSNEFPKCASRLHQLSQGAIDRCDCMHPRFDSNYISINKAGNLIDLSEDIEWRTPHLLPEDYMAPSGDANSDPEPAYELKWQWGCDMDDMESMLPEYVLTRESGAQDYLRDMIITHSNSCRKEVADFILGKKENVECNGFKIRSDQRRFIKLDDPQSKERLFLIKPFVLNKFTSEQKISGSRTDLKWNEIFCTNPCDLTTCCIPISYADEINLEGKSFEDDFRCGCYPKLVEIPKELREASNLKTLYLDDNEIKKIENLPKNLKNLHLFSNKIEILENLPDSLEHLNIHSNEIKKIENLPKNLKKLSLSSNKIEILENLPDSLEHLIIHSNEIKKIENLPKNLKKLSLSSNKIEILENLPDSLEHLHISSNKIKKIENLPKNLKILYLNYNKIETLENLPDSLEQLYIEHNDIEDVNLDELPLSLETIRIGKKDIEEYVIRNRKYNLFRLKEKRILGK